jgi:hypothetical protein
MTTFKKGDRVVARLTGELEHGGDLAHPGRFLRYHPGDREWAEIELDEEHAGDTRTLHVPVECLERSDEAKS